MPAHEPDDHDGRISVAERFYPRTLHERYDKLRDLDPHFADLWLTYLSGLYSREALDVRTRLLILTGQYAMRQDEAALRETIDAALTEGVDAREVLEAILHCYVYGGEAPVFTAVDVFTDVVGRAGLLDDVRDRGLPKDATTRGRSLEAEMRGWHPDDRDDARLPDLLERHDWRGISTANRLRPRSQINNVSYFDALDAEQTELWASVVYGGVLARRVFDDKTRALVITGYCLALRETFQYTRHMEVALRAGATPAELLELVYQSCHVLGHALPLGVVINDLLKLVDQLGRLDELVADESKRSLVRKVRDARIAMRLTVGDLKTSDVGLDGIAALDDDASGRRS